MNLNEVAELSFNQLFPKSGGENSIDKVEFQRTAFAEFAYFTLMASYNERASEGYFEPPSYLLAEKELDVVDNEMDISSIKPFRSLPQDVWLVKVGNDVCTCKYIKTTANLNQLLCDDDSLDDADKTYYLVGKKIKFPKGTHKNTLPIMYASMDSVNGYIEVSEDIASLVRKSLNEIYLGKVAPVDVTNNSNANN